jgi:hypothetical protein
MVCLSMILFLGGCTYYPSIDEAILSEWDYPIKVLYVDEKKNTVIFLDPEDQYIFNTFENKDHKYRYSAEGEDAWRVTGKSGPLFLRAINREKVGNVVWGVVNTDRKAVKVEVIFTNKTNPEIQVKMTIPVKNNVFIGYPEQDFFGSEESLYNEWTGTAKAFDENNNIVAVSNTYY